ncbi:hypothetical protein AAWM_04687 [Aspergillus awamori]|uniref:Uncharacterized protein n=1 Tax=Aspergillus awamori TaxID=105351 RepID=A0A401KRD2_ASPAW|nr:hypothetical protein AAWM_04687 [Aspergillus awamori]
MGHSGPPVDSQPWGRAPKTREHTSRAGGIPTGRGGRAPPFLKRGPEGPVRHQSRRGDLPGREEVWVGFQQLRSAAFHLPHSTTGLPWPTDRRANVRWSKSDWGGSRLSIYRNSPISPGQLVNSTPHHPYKVGYLHAACPNPRPSTAILALPWPPRCLAIRARPTPIPARLSPRRLASPHLTWPTGQFPSPARTHATLRGHRTPACLAPRRERRPVSRPRPTGAPAQRGRPSCVQTFCGPKVIRGGRPPAHRVLATVSRGQLVNGLCRARGPGRPPCLDPARVKSTRCRIHSVLGWVSPAKSNGQLANEVGRKRRREGPLAHGRESHPRGPLQPPGAAGPQQGYLTAYTTRLVTSVVCRGFIPARGDIAIRQPAPRGFSLGAVASLLRCMARRPIRIQLRRAGQHRRVPARILT